MTEARSVSSWGSYYRAWEASWQQEREAEIDADRQQEVEREMDLYDRRREMELSGLMRMDNSQMQKMMADRQADRDAPTQTVFGEPWSTSSPSAGPRRARSKLSNSDRASNSDVASISDAATPPIDPTPPIDAVAARQQPASGGSAPRTQVELSMSAADDNARHRSAAARATGRRQKMTVSDEADDGTCGGSTGGDTDAAPRSSPSASRSSGQSIDSSIRSGYGRATDTTARGHQAPRPMSSFRPFSSASSNP
jgi:hypothetical protein